MYVIKIIQESDKENFLLCRVHYIEYLVRLINVNKIDPITMLEEEDLWYVLRRDNLERPRKLEGESKPNYWQRMREVRPRIFCTPW